MSPSTNYPWQRYWVRQGENPAMQDDYFVEPTSDKFHWFGPQSNGAALIALKDVPCLVLLGDVGMGKSTVIAAEAELLRNILHGQKHEVVLCDLKRLTEEQIYRQVFGDPKVQEWIDGKHSLTLFLDSLDECWRRIEELESILVGELQKCFQKKPPSLFLRLTCRSAEWRGNVGQALKRLFPAVKGQEDKVQIFTLAPLSKNNIQQAAQARACDGSDLLKRIEEKDAQPLASHPITFEMLFQIYRQGGVFPSSRVELYERGCLELCLDPHSEFASEHQRTTTPHQRLMIASRLAALSVLTNRYLINGDTEHPLSRIDVLESVDAFGHFEERLGGDRVAVARETTSEALQTALFGERSEGAQSWRHQSYAEFLCARYLAQSNLSTDQIITLLTDTSDNSRRLIPQLEETACWLADMRSSVFDALASTNADIFIRCDPKNLTATRGKQLVDGYLDLIRSHEAPELDWQLKHHLARVNHPDLAQQLDKAILNKGENPLVRETALDIAGYCKCDALGTELVRVFLDKDDVFRVRKHAAFALENIANESIRVLLKQQATAESLKDGSDEMLGYYLKILWPTHLSITEVLALLKPPKKRNYLGSYRMFLEHGFVESVADSDLPQVLDWTREEKIHFDITAPFGYFPSRVASRALETIDIANVKDAFLRLLQSLEDHLHNLFQENIDKLDLPVKARNAFWVAIAEADLKEINRLVLYGRAREIGLLTPDDLPFFIERYEVTEDEKQKKHWLELVFYVFNPNDSVTLELVSNLANTDSVVADTLARYTSCPLVPDKDNWQKKHYEQNQKATAAKKSRSKNWFNDQIEASLKAFEGGVTHAFWWTIELLQHDPAAESGGFIFPTLQLSEGKAWKALSIETRARILAAAPLYLEAQSVNDADVWDKVKYYRPYDLVNPLLVLLFDESRETLEMLSPALWQKWVSVVFAYNDRQNGSHEKASEFIMSLAFNKARAESMTALKKFIALHINDDNKRRVIQQFGTAWNSEIKQALLAVFSEKSLKLTAAKGLFYLLHAHEPLETKQLLEGIFDERNNSEACSIHVPTAGGILLTQWFDEWGLKIIEVCFANPLLGKRIIWSLFWGIGHTSDWISKLPAHTVVEFWLWLEAQFPGDPYDEDDGVHNITPSHDMFHFRQGVFEHLIKRGTRDACAAMIYLMRKRPNDFWMGDILADMRKAARRASWARPNPISLMNSFADKEKRLIRTAGDLQKTLVEAIQRFEATLHAAPPSLELWNDPKENRMTIWSPKDENNLSTRLKLHFERDLENRAILSNREVQISPKLGDDPAQLVDILVQAIPFGEDGKPGKAFTVVVEVKCAWNNGVLEDMEKQLYARYLANNEYDFGIYAVAYFTCNAWNRPNDARKISGASTMKVDELKMKLCAQAKTLSSSEKQVEALVINACIAEN